MENEKWLVIGEDSRLKELATLLRNPSRTVFYKKTSVWNEELNKLVLEFQPDKIVLPILPLKIEVEQLYGTSKAIFYTGRLTMQWKQLLEKNQSYGYLQQESFIWQNARLTAEGFIAIFYGLEQKCVYGQHFTIAGFGRIAKMLAALLVKMGASVHVVARSVVQISEARAYGYTATNLDEKKWPLKDSYFINTIPAQWLTETFKDHLPRVLFDLASEPGCLDVDAEQLETYILLPSLPGKYFPHDAAAILCKAVEEEPFC
ncbi:MAG: dipicolinate synthase [Lysinibacillus sp.]